MLGLNDYYLPRHRPADIGSGYLGHELGDGDYVLGRAPDIIVFHIGTGPSFRSGREMSNSKEFHQQYARIRVQTAFEPYYSALVWFRVNSSKIGVHRTEDGLTIPGYLMNTFDHTSAFLENGLLVVGVKAGNPVGIRIESLSSDCKIEIVSQHADMIERTIERDAKGGLIILTTDSDVACLLSRLSLQKHYFLESSGAQSIQSALLEEEGACRESL